MKLKKGIMDNIFTRRAFPFPYNLESNGNIKSEVSFIEGERNGFGIPYTQDGLIKYIIIKMIMIFHGIMMKINKSCSNYQGMFLSQVCW